MRYITVNSQSDMDSFKRKVDNFHDALLREVSVVARGFVDKALQMYGDADPFDMRCIVQQQSHESPYIDMVFESVKSVFFTSPFPLNPIGIVTEDNVKFSFTGTQNECIVAKKMKYRILAENMLGSNLTAVREIASGSQDEAILLDEKWRQCPVCLEAFEIHAHGDYYRCSSCGKLLWDDGNIGRP